MLLPYLAARVVFGLSVASHSTDRGLVSSQALSVFLVNHSYIPSLKILKETSNNTGQVST